MSASRAFSCTAARTSQCSTGTKSSRPESPYESSVDDPAHFQEKAKGSFVVAGLKHRGVVIPEDRDQIAATSQIEKLVENALGIDPTVDVIAEGDDGVGWLGFDGGDQGRQGGLAAVNIADGRGCGGHAGIVGKEASPTESRRTTLMSSRGGGEGAKLQGFSK